MQLIYQLGTDKMQDLLIAAYLYDILAFMCYLFIFWEGLRKHC